MIENREQSPRLAEMVYLENEVMELKDSSAYLNHHLSSDSNHLDLLLGVQGWRRYILTHYDNISQINLNKARLAMAWVDGQTRERCGRDVIDIFQVH